jgi:hypothetical protein
MNSIENPKCIVYAKPEKHVTTTFSEAASTVNVDGPRSIML